MSEQGYLVLTKSRDQRINAKYACGIRRVAPTEEDTRRINLKSH